MKADLDLLNRFMVRAERVKPFNVYKPLLRGIQAFNLDNETVEVVAEMASGERRHKMIPLYRELARLPFDHVWIEFDYHHLHSWRSERGLTNTLDSEHGLVGVPQQMGFLCERLVKHEEGMRITTVGWMSPDARAGLPPDACLFPICHNLTTGRDKVIFAGHRADVPGMAEIIDDANRSQLPVIAWGIDRGDSDLTQWTSNPLSGTNGVEPEGTYTDLLLAKYGYDEGMRRIAGSMGHFCNEQRGDLRFVVAALALLNHVPVIYKPHRPKGRMLASNTTRPFLESRVVTIDVPQGRRRIKMIDKELRNSLALQRRKRHRVRGHWRISPTPHGPRWELYVDPFTLNKRWRIWIADHERGDASLGWVDHIYHVTGRPGARAAVGLELDDHPEASR